MILTDVTLRDGLQAESQIIPLDQKLKLLELLSCCGFDRLEITSFVNPKWVPQLSDSEKLCELWFKQNKPQQTMAFVPNAKGCERLLKFPIPWVSCFVAASPTFNQKNVNAPIENTIDEIKSVISLAKAAKRKVRIYVSTVWGCPYEGAVSVKTLESVLSKITNLGAEEIALSDTIGVATPQSIKEVLKLSSQHIKLEQTALHLHNTYGFALANIQAGVETGVTRFDGSMGGIGGCPYAKGATGNVASDDILSLLFREKYMSHFPKDEVTQTLKFLSKEVKLNLQSALSKIMEKGGVWYGI